MAQELIKTETGEVAARSRLRSRVAELFAAIERDGHYRDTLPAAISYPERRALEIYRRELHGRLRGIGQATAEQETARTAISIFLGGYLNAKADAKSASQAYVAILLEMPLFAIITALDDFKNGRVYDLDAEGKRIPFTLDYAPSAPRILDQAKKHIDSIAEERGKVIRLLAIDRVKEPEISDAERERVAVLMRDLADGMLMRSEADREAAREKIRAEAQEARDRTKRILADARRRNPAAQDEQING